MVSMVRVVNCKTCPALAGFVRYGIADTICDHRGNLSLLADGSPNCGGAEYVILNEGDCE